MKPTSEKSAIFVALKYVLKNQGLTYRHLAKKLNASESSVKRLFSIEESSLSRLSEILKVLNLSFADLTEIMSQENFSVTTFSLEAEEFLAEALDYFFVYRKLFHHRSVVEVMKREKLSKQQMSKYLKKFDELDMLKRMPGDKIQFSTSDFLKFREDGPLKDAVYKSWGKKFHNLVLENLNNDEYFLKIVSLQCSAKLRQSFLDESERLLNTFLKQAAVETKSKTPDIKPVGVSLAVGPHRVGLDESDFVVSNTHGN